MDINLSEMSVPELRRLQGKLETEIRRRDETARRDVLKQFKKIAAEHGVSLDEVLADAPAKSAPKAAPKPRRKAASPAKGKRVPMKYRNPEDPKAGWTGRGRKPRWVEAWLEAGKSLDELLIK
ncbi:H-NS histone family protein [Denitromonas iodatirespirans]|uniref:H-NS histone family protein n=1 Tax=Denitromonas iodatirespirans TaxID=2795389 RepID=UPI001E45BD99|nr:H-NS histone family protein [Denitromonas iodatirespirans]